MTYIAKWDVVLRPDATLHRGRAAAQGSVLTLGDTACEEESPVAAAGIAAVSSAIIVAALDWITGYALDSGWIPESAAQESGR